MNYSSLKWKFENLWLLGTQKHIVRFSNWNLGSFRCNFEDCNCDALGKILVDLPMESGWLRCHLEECDYYAHDVWFKWNQCSFIWHEGFHVDSLDYRFWMILGYSCRLLSHAVGSFIAHLFGTSESSQRQRYSPGRLLAGAEGIRRPKWVPPTLYFWKNVTATNFCHP